VSFGNRKFGPKNITEYKKQIASRWGFANLAVVGVVIVSVETH
jgi:hypothetical protein